MVSLSPTNGGQVSDPKLPVSASRWRARVTFKLDRFDAVTALLTALMILFGVLVSLMLVVWLLRVSVLPDQMTAHAPSFSSVTPIGFVDDFEPPGLEEVEALVEPSLADAIEAITEMPSHVAASPFPVSSDAAVSSQGPNSGGPLSRTSGPDDEDSLGRPQRWEITFNAGSRQDYAEQLDFFGIELAAFGGGENIIESASNLSSDPARSINRDPGSEKRLYFSWKHTNPLLQFDRQLLAAAGIATEGRNLIRFAPPELVRRLTILESQFCEANGKVFPDDIAKTVFESQRSENGFEFRVVSQRYRLGAVVR